MVSVLLLGVAGLLAAEPPASFVLPVDDAVFPSHFRVAIAPDPTVHVVGFAVTADAGSQWDPVGREGLAHLVEHLAFRATLSDGRTVGDALDAAACVHNAFTEWDVVRYEVVCPAAEQDLALTVAALWSTTPLRGVDDAAFGAERDIVTMEEQLGRHQGSTDAGTLALRVLDPDGPYARPIGGTNASLPALTLDDARAHAASRYRADRVSLTIVGAVRRDVVWARLFELLPPRTFGASGADLTLRRWTTSAGTRMWPSEPGHPDRPLRTLAPTPRSDVPWELPEPPAGVARVSVPGMDDERGARPGLVIVLPPSSLVPNGFEGFDLARVIERAIEERLQDAGRDDFLTSCWGRQAARATLVTCEGWFLERRPNQPVPDAAPVAALMAEGWAELLTRRVAGRDPTLEVSLASQLGYLQRLERVAWPGGETRLGRLADAVHAGQTGDALEQEYNLLTRTWTRQNALRFCVGQARYVRVVPLVFDPAPALDPVVGEGAPPRTGAALTTALATSSPLLARKDWASTTLPNGLTIVALRYGMLPTLHVGWYHHLDGVLDIERELADDALYGGQWWSSWSASEAVDASGDVALRRDGLAMIYRAAPNNDLLGLLRDLRDDLRLLVRNAGGSRVADVLRASNPAIDPWAGLSFSDRRRFADVIASSRARTRLARDLVSQLGTAPIDQQELDAATFAALRAAPRTVVPDLLRRVRDPRGSVLVVAGKMDPEHAVSAASSVFTDQRGDAPASVAAPPLVRAAPRTGLVLWHDDDSSTSMVSVQVRCAIPEDGVDRAVLGDLLSRAADHAMEVTFRGETGAAYDPRAWVDVGTRQVRLLLSVTVPAAQAVRAISAVREVVVGLGRREGWPADSDPLRELAWRGREVSMQSASQVSTLVAESLLLGESVEVAIGVAPQPPFPLDRLLVAARTCAEREVIVVSGRVRSLEASLADAFPGVEITTIDQSADAAR